MDAYPGDYVDHNLPLILLSGLGPDDVDAGLQESANRKLFIDGGFKIKTEIPPMTGAVAEGLLDTFSAADSTNRRWNGRAGSGQDNAPPFKVKRVGRTYTLPPRKAAAPPNSSRFGGSLQSSRGSESFEPTLHSPLSPLTPISPVFPDGIFTPLWIAKHQHYLPAAFLTFLPFTADPNISSLKDNQLKSEINNIRSVVTSANYKLKIVVVLVCEDDEGPLDLDERLASIRRATGLEGKNALYYIPPDIAQGELGEVVKSILVNVKSSAEDYYRDLTRHARKKRSRGSVPPPTAPPTSGTSQTLPLPGWIARYEFKLGVFSEFRQEMERACENYEKAYEALFGQEVFEAITVWSPRFNEARLLADAIAIRIIRCQLWSGQTTSSVRTWASHRTRMQGMIDRKGKGSETYGWEAWEAVWSKTMAQLIERADLPTLNLVESIDPQIRKAAFIFSNPEKAIPLGERVRPWELLHHEGYWLDSARKHTQNRRQLAAKIPEEDSQARNLNETYLGLDSKQELTLDHSTLVVEDLKSSTSQFARRQQNRMAERLQLEIGLERMRTGAWPEALSVLRPLWKTLSWRQAGWWRLVEELGWAVRECASRTGDSETLIQVDWEMHNRTFSPRPGWQYNLHDSLQGVPSQEAKPAVVFKAEDVLSPLAPSFAFGSSNGNVGEPMRSQLVISSLAHPGSSPITLSEVKVVFEGSLRTIRILSEESFERLESDQVIGVVLRDSANSFGPSSLQSPTGGLASLVGLADLTFHPGQTKAFDLTSVPREAGDVMVASITLMIEEQKFSLAYVQTDLSATPGLWFDRGPTNPIRRHIGRDRTVWEAKILPKPPKMRITTPNIRESYYTDEQIHLKLELANKEADAAVVEVAARVFGQGAPPLRLAWLSEDGNEVTVDQLETTDDPHEDRPFPKRSIGELDSLATKTLTVSISDTWDPFDYELEISAVYYLPGIDEPEIKTITVDISLVRAFEATNEFAPRLHLSPWPNFFHVEDPDHPITEDTDEAEERPEGIIQKWCLSTKTASFASETLVIESLTLSLQTIGGGGVCTLSPEDRKSPGGAEIAPEEIRKSEFTIDVRKLTLEDRRHILLDLNLDIRWRRADYSPSSSSSLSTLIIPRFTIPMAEPRVLATVSPSKTLLPSLLHLDYILENPSMHFLTFNLTMEPSEDFAFSGPKLTNLSLVPLSRQTVRCNLLASKPGTWIQPSLVVLDAYFNQRLRVQGASAGMRIDKKGVLVWVDG